MAALREAKARGAHILSIVNVVGSSIARESDDVLYTWAGPEIAVATTKAYSTQLVLLDMLGLYFADALGTVSAAQYDEIIEELLRLPGKMEQMLEDIEDIKHFASNYFNHNSVFFIGRNLDYAMGLEGSLKLKEISYIHSEAYASGELKHGTISLIEDGTLVIALGTYEPLFDKAMSNVVEVQARGADVLALTTDSNVAEMKKTVENVISVPETHTILQPSLGVVPLQLFAYYVALLRGCETVVLESNHDPHMLQAGPYPYALKQRVAGPNGHLSNPDCAVFAAFLADNGTRKLVLAHLSEKNNMPALALQQTKNALRGREGCTVCVAPRDCMESPVVLGEEETACLVSG